MPQRHRTNAISAAIKNHSSRRTHTDRYTALSRSTYRHVIDSLVSKPGAFRNYRYREEMFPTSQFRIAYDLLQAAHTEKVADKRDVQILELAAHECQDAVADVRRAMIATDAPIDVESIRALVLAGTHLPAANDMEVDRSLDSFSRRAIIRNERRFSVTFTRGRGSRKTLAPRWCTETSTRFDSMTERLPRADIASR